MDPTWLILDDAFFLFVSIWLAILLVAPIEYANSFWLGGALFMLASAGTAITVHGPASTTTMTVGGQLLVYSLLAAIIVARDHAQDGDLGAADRLISIAAFLGSLTTNNDRPQRSSDHQQSRQRPRHQPPWQRQNGQQREQRGQQATTDNQIDTHTGLDLDSLVDDRDDTRDP